MPLFLRGRLNIVSLVFLSIYFEIKIETFRIHAKNVYLISILISAYSLAPKKKKKYFILESLIIIVTYFLVQNLNAA